MADQPRYMGGQAVVEGVMMRGATTWAVAVRNPEGAIDLEVHDAPSWAEKYAKVPLLRGVMNLAESMALGMKALSWSANQQVPEEERIGSKAMGVTMAIALVFFAGFFIVLPALGARGLASVFGIDGFLFHVLEGALVLGIFLGYLAAVGLMPDIKRVFQYHGAEHKAIAAYENDVAAHPGVGPALHHPARALRDQLPAHRARHRDHRVLGHRATGAADPRPLPAHPHPGHRRHRVRGDPVRRAAHGQAVGPRRDEAGAHAAAHDDA